LSFSQYKRVLLKLSGDILKGNEKSGIDFNLVGRIAEEIKRVSSSGIEVCIVVGGGNLFRGSEAEKIGYDRIIADNMGMLSTVINAMAIQNALENTGIQSRVMSAIGIQELVEPFIRRRAIRHLEKKRVVVFAAGTGNPYFTTDTAAALRATQVSADIILKGTKVDGVYDRDPKLDTEAIRFGEIDYMKVISQGLKVMDLTAITFCQDNKIPICVFDLTEEGNLWRVISGEQIGTMVKEIQE
jgi:uridylate kinase